MILNLTNCKCKSSDFVRRYLGDKVHIVKGQYFKEYDLDEEKYTSDEMNKIKKKFISGVESNKDREINFNIPLGFNRRELPKGATIREAENDH